MEQERCDDRAALRAAERHDPLAVEDLERPQNPELHDTTKPQLRAVVTAGGVSPAGTPLQARFEWAVPGSNQ